MFLPQSARILGTTLCIIATSHYATARVDLGGGHMGLAMAGTTCSSASGVACTELGDDWPDMGLACPEAHHDIPRHTLAIMSATIIQLGHYQTVQEKDFPVDECYTGRPNSTVASYGFISQGTFDMWFFAHDRCHCQPKQTLICHDRATEAEKCNLRTHHDGWKPSTESDGHHASAGSNHTHSPSESQSDLHLSTYRFDPTHRQQSIFNDLSSFGWKLMQMFGFWGVI